MERQNVSHQGMGRKMDFKKNNAVTRDDPQGQFLAQQRCNVGKMLQQSFETMSQECCDAVLH